jgi:branched-chain amino acid transport system substrate-binding protein
LTRAEAPRIIGAVKGAAAVLIALLAGLVTACAGGGDATEPVATSSCGALLYEGEGEPDVIVVSDLPLRGIGADTGRLMVDAIEFTLRERSFEAGEFRVGYQSCTDTVGEDPFDPGLCRRNVRAYIDTEAVMGMIGPWNSGCAYEQIPIASREEAGPLAIVSPSNTNPELTRTEVSRSLYPEPGVRSYTRVVTHQFTQGVATAHLAKRLGARKVVVLQQDLADPYIRYLFEPFVAAAPGLGIELAVKKWVFQKSYTELASSVAAEDPDVVYLAGGSWENAKTLIEDLRAALRVDVELVGPDAFAFSGIAQELGPAGAGMLVTVPGIPAELLPPAGKRFAREFGRAAVLEPGQLGAYEAAQSAEVLLDAISRSDGTRASVVEELFATKVENGILGSFSFDRYGDIVPAPVGIYRIENGDLVADDVVRAPLNALKD